MEVTILPGHGGKITSLRHKASGREWLAQPANPLQDPPVYGSPFTAGAMCGWDEMLPTIIACQYPSPDPLHGVHLPDHGEVWALEWAVRDETHDSVLMSVEGRVLPYRLERRVTLAGPSMRLDYRLTVTGREPLWLLWAAHPQFTCLRGTRLVLPEPVRQLVDVTSPGKPVRCAYPGDAPDRVDALPPGEGRKLYALPDALVSWAALTDSEGSWLRMSWDPAQLRYLGIWLDNRAYSRDPVAALEPSTGFYDDLALAQRSGRAPHISAGTPMQWSLEVTAGQGDGGRPNTRRR